MRIVELVSPTSVPGAAFPEAVAPAEVLAPAVLGDELPAADDDDDDDDDEQPAARAMTVSMLAAMTQNLVFNNTMLRPYNG
jgi:hypothetical protein